MEAVSSDEEETDFCNGCDFSVQDVDGVPGGWCWEDIVEIGLWKRTLNLGFLGAPLGVWNYVKVDVERCISNCVIIT